MMIYLKVNYEETDRELARLSAKIRQVKKMMRALPIIMMSDDNDHDNEVKLILMNMHCRVKRRGQEGRLKLVSLHSR